jgi:transposase-like protein
MGRIRRKFEPEFKLRIVQKILSGQQSQSSIAREYGIAMSVLKGWIERYSRQDFDQNRLTATEKCLLEENRQLKEKLAELYMQVELLKKIPSFVQIKRNESLSIVTASSLAQSPGGAK